MGSAAWSASGWARKAVRAVEQAGGIARAFQANVADPDAIRRLVDDVESAFGGLDADAAPRVLGPHPRPHP